ncbi:hypothetical protein B9Q02_03705 [Candidatus Marsarchaeota G1 archaeon BE_D]|uniref:Branched-chain amino acid ABC transporter permease n=1 Tax=Candidatus Marsarchaeota G1 archaeon BE_D TaxID=1978156 RepID=A0A2R6AI99_9ARCH|nr:MAG: hypothetical protein B9Q02_03705 [Candidatus Marsarchaeota G1 archaeon BE_D]
MNTNLKSLSVFLLLLFVPLIAYVSFLNYFSVIVLALFYSALGSAWDILGGRTGQLSFGNSAFLAIGAYTSTLLFLDFHLTPWIGLIFAGIFASVSALPLGLISLRLKGPFFVVGTFAFVEVIQLLLTHFVKITGGDIGLIIPLTNKLIDMESNNPLFYAYLIEGILFLAIGVNYLLSNSRTGYLLIAIKEDEDVASSLGIRTTIYKVFAFLISAFITGMVGTFYAQYYLFITPTNTASIPLSIQIAITAIIGGSGKIWGPVLGGFLLETLAFAVTFLPPIPGLDYLIYGVLLISVLILSPGGIYEIFTKRGLAK